MITFVFIFVITRLMDFLLVIALNRGNTANAMEACWGLSGYHNDLKTPSI
jgi:hypothetical protein